MRSGSRAWCGTRPREAPYPITAVSDAENAARALRTHWGLGIDPILNLAELLEERGIKVLSVGLSDIDGLTAKVRRRNGEPIPVIVIKEGEWSERKRFTLAHELGHMVMDVRPGVDAEKAANRFAGTFLMPAEALWSEIGKHRTMISLGELIRLKEVFGASFQAMVYRCHVSRSSVTRPTGDSSKLSMNMAGASRPMRSSVHSRRQRASPAHGTGVLGRSD